MRDFPFAPILIQVSPLVARKTNQSYSPKSGFKTGKSQASVNPVILMVNSVIFPSFLLEHHMQKTTYYIFLSKWDQDTLAARIGLRDHMILMAWSIDMWNHELLVRFNWISKNIAKLFFARFSECSENLLPTMYPNTWFLGGWVNL